MNGLHLTADLSGCAELALLVDQCGLARSCRATAEAAELTVVGEHWHRFPDRPDGQPGGITGMLLLAESHVAIHTWPELAAVTLDVYVCNFRADNSRKARALMDSLVDHFAASTVDRQELQRGRPGGATAHTVP